MRTRTYARVPGMRVRMLPRKGQEKGSLWLLIGRVRISSVHIVKSQREKPAALLRRILSREGIVGLQ